MSEFDWGRARQRRAADIDSATGANPNTHKSKAGVYPNSRTPWRRHQLLVNPDSSDSHGQKGSGGVEGETRDSDSSPRQYLGDTKRQNLNPRLIQKQYVKKENRLSKKQRTISVINLTDFVSLKDKDPESAKITACEDAGSYNWLNATVPTILIPGMRENLDIALLYHPDNSC